MGWGEEDGDARGEAVKSRSSFLLPLPLLSSSLESIVSGGGASSSSTMEVAGSARRRERWEEGRAVVKEQPESVLTRSIGGDERRQASSRSGSLACKEATLDQDEGRNGTRRGW